MEEVQRVRLFAAPFAGGDERRVLLISPYNVSLRPWYGVVWEFFDVVAGLERATRVAPPARRRYGGPRNPVSDELTRIRAKASNAVRRALRRPSTAIMENHRVEEDHDLCLFVCQFPHEIAELRRVAGWRERSRFACAFVLETWPHVLPRFRGDLALLDRFDHVFTMNPQSVDLLARYTRAPISFLPTGADCLRVGGTSADAEAERCIDLLSVGRSNRTAHTVLGDFAQARDLLYVYDIWSGMQVPDWAAARRMNAELVRRAKHFMVWDPATLLVRNDPGMAGQSAISTRYFEGAAGGATLLGSRPRLPEFDRLFDWPDAVIELPGEPAAMAEALAALWADPARSRRAGRANRVQALLRHDWAYRWDAVLRIAGLTRTPAHQSRIALLRRCADDEEAAAGARAALSRRAARAAG